MTELEKTVQDLRRMLEIVREENTRLRKELAEAERIIEEVRRSADEFARDI